MPKSMVENIWLVYESPFKTCDIESMVEIYGCFKLYLFLSFIYSELHTALSRPQSISSEESNKKGSLHPELGSHSQGTNQYGQKWSCNGLPTITEVKCGWSISWSNK